jgi:hypothetical protein
MGVAGLLQWVKAAVGGEHKRPCSGPTAMSLKMDSRHRLRRTVLLGAAAITLGLSLAASAQAAAPKDVRMIHMFSVRFADGVTPQQKATAVSRVRDLQGKIPGLLEMSIGLNESPRGQGFELGGTMRFTDRAALAAYNDHPEHQKLLAWLGPLVAQAVEVDFPG